MAEAAAGGVPPGTALIAAERLEGSSASARRLPFALLAVMTSWLAYLVLLPWLWSEAGLIALLAVPTLGVYLVIWLGLYLHELWHGYMPRLNNAIWFNLTCLVLLADRQIYRQAHSTHHKFVHKPDDMEFFCENWEADRVKRKRQFVLELLFGSIAWGADTEGRLKKSGKIDERSVFGAFLTHVAFVVGLILVALLLTGPAFWQVLVICALTLWFGAIVSRHNQWVEHLGIVSTGNLAERNLLRRNLSSRTWGGWLFNFISHTDAEEHVYHHTDTRYSYRAIKGLPLPEGAQVITIRNYMSLLLSHYRSL